RGKSAESGDGAVRKREAVLVAVRVSDLLLLLRSRFARWRNNIFEPHVSNHVAVVLVVMHVAEGQHAQFRHVTAEELHHLTAHGVRHTVVNFITISERIL